jgi:hypothetical protein
MKLQTRNTKNLKAFLKTTVVTFTTIKDVYAGRNRTNDDYDFINRIDMYLKNHVFIESFIKTDILEDNKDFLSWILFELNIAEKTITSITIDEFKSILNTRYSSTCSKTEDEINNILLDGLLNHKELKNEIFEKIHI